MVVLDPESWRDKPFYLALYIDRGSVLLDGQWQVILYHEHCPRCQTLISDVLNNPDRNHQIALVEIPPLVNRSHPMNTNVYWLHLTETIEWFVETPVIVQVRDGQVE